MIPTFTTGRPQRAKAVYIMTQTRSCELPPRLVEEEIRDESVKDSVPVAVPVLLHTQDILGIVVRYAFQWGVFSLHGILRWHLVGNLHI